MGAAMQLIVKGSLLAYVVAFGMLSLLLQVFVPYKKYVRYLRWLTVVLFAYVITAFLVHVSWGSARISAVRDRDHWNRFTCSPGIGRLGRLCRCRNISVASES
jgi:hypothetical protein